MSNNAEYTCNFKTTARKLNRIKIKDVLDKADENNTQLISIPIPKFRTDLKAPDVKIDGLDSDSGEDSISLLKTTLESMVFEDEELKGYYEGLKTRLNKKKIDEIYSIVTANIPYGSLKRSLRKTSSKQYSLKDTKTFSIGKTAKSLKIEKTPRDNPSFIQETLIDEPDDTQTSELLVPENNSSVISSQKNASDEQDNSSQLSFDIVEKNTEKSKQDDINLKIAFDMISGDDEDLSEYDDEKEDIENESSEKNKNSQRKKAVSSFFSSMFRYRTTNEDEIRDEEKEQDSNDEYNGFEYNSVEDKQEAEKLLKDSVYLSLKKLGLACLLFLFFIALKYFSVENEIFAKYISYSRYGVLYILFEIQLLFLGVFIHKGAFINGIKSFLTGKFSSDSVFAATTIFASAHSIFSIFASNEKIVLFNAIPILMSLYIGISTYLKNKKNLSCFKIISTDKEKFAAAELSPASKEASSFYSYLLEDSDVYTVSKSRFVSSFFKRISKKPKSEDILNAIIPGVFFISTIIFSICFFYGKMSVYDSFTALTAFILSAMPAASFFVISIPLVSANRICNKIDSAIIGESVAEEYANASVISFEDIELFPPDKVTMKDMKVYHNMRIDQIVVELAKLFSHIGGPLKDFFAQSVNDVFEEHNVIKVLESSENGIMIAADGNDYYLGNGAFMRSHGLSYDEDEEDQKYERTGGSVMVFGANSVVAAKFYFRYVPQKGFKKLLEHMYKSGLCIGIKTLDPNINNDLLYYHSDGSQCPISILKSSAPEEITSKVSSVDSGIISNRSLGAFLKAFMTCDKARHSIKSNGIIMLTGSALTSIMMIFISITGGIVNFSPTHAFILQLLWSMAVFILSFWK